MNIANDWKDYQILDMANGEKLEKWGSVILRRPDPQAMWNVSDYSKWRQVDGVYF